MREAVVIQWARLGDLLQTRVLLRRLLTCGEYSQIRVVADGRYADLLRLFPEQLTHWPIDLSLLSALARHESGHAAFLQNAAASLSQSVSLADCDAYVLNGSKSAAQFVELLSPRQVLGYRLDNERLVVPDAIQCVEHEMAAGTPLPVHLADIWAGFAPEEKTVAWLPRLSVPAQTQSQANLRIGLFCDAGTPDRSLPADWITVLMNLLCAAGAKVTLFGQCAGSSDFGSDSFTTDSFRDLRGKTSLKVLIQEVAALDTVIGPDTGGLHLAAALGIQTIGLFSNGATAHHTGPYAADSVVIQYPPWNQAAAACVTDVVLNRSCRKMNNAGYPDIYLPSMDRFGIVYLSQGNSDYRANMLEIRQQYFKSMTPRSNGRKQVHPLSIVIPECGVEHYTDELINRLRNELTETECEIIVVTSGASANRNGFDSDAIPVHVIRSQAPLNFAEACCRGSQNAKHEFLLFLNNDIEFEPGSLKRLAASASPNEILGPVLLYADGTIQNAGIAFENGCVVELGHSLLSLESSKYNIMAVSGSALLVHKSVFERLNGFDPAFVNGYEDLDFCLRAREIGIACRIVKESELVHFRGASEGRYDREHENKNLFFQRWNNILSRPSTKPVFSMPIPPAKIVVLSDLPVHAAGSLTRWVWPLEQLGYKEEIDWLWLEESAAENRSGMLTSLLERTQTVAVFRPLRSPTVQQALIESRIRSGFRLIVDCDDLILNRFPQGSRRAVERHEYESRFRMLLGQADVVIAATDQLAEHLRIEGFDAIPLPTRLWQHQMHRNRHTGTCNTNVRIAFFGDPSHQIDLASVVPAVRQVLDLRPNARFYWWGCHPVELATHPQVRQGGPLVADYRIHLARLHAFAPDLVIVPLLNTVAARAKTPIKYLEYVSAGIPGVYSNVLPYNRVVQNSITGLLAGDTTSEWTSALLRLIDDRMFRRKISALAMQNAEMRVQEEDSVFERVISRGESHVQRRPVCV